MSTDYKHLTLVYPKHLDTLTALTGPKVSMSSVFTEDRSAGDMDTAVGCL